MFTIRQAKVGEEKVIEQVYLQKVEELADRNIVQWEKEEVLWDTLSKSYIIEQFYLVYTNDKELVGAFVVVNYDPTYWVEDKEDDALYIHKVMVLDKVRKQGASKYILEYFKTMGKELGYPSVKLDVRAHKEKLIAYYESNAFQLVKTVDLHKGYLTCLYEYRYEKE